MPAFTDCFLQNVADDEVLAHCFRGCTALGDDVEHCAFDVYDVKECQHSFRVYVVFNEELYATLLFGEVVVAEMAECVEHCCGAKCASADAQDNKVVIVGSDVCCGCNNIVYDFVLVVRKFRPAGHAGATVVFKIIKGCFCNALDCFDVLS